MTGAAMVWNEGYKSLAGVLVGRAQTSIALRMFLVETRFKRDPAGVSALLDDLAHAAARGVSVRVLLSATKDLGIRVANVASAGLLAALGVDVRVEGGGDHGKYLLVDGELSVIGSHNWTSAAIGSNVECSVALRDRTTCEALSDEFDKRWYRADATFVSRAFPELAEVVKRVKPEPLKSTPATQHLPEFVQVRQPELLLDNAYTEQLLGRLATAKKSIQVMMFRFSARIGHRDVTDTILDALKSAKQRGVAVQVLLDYDDIGDERPSDLINTRSLEALKAAGVEVRCDTAKRLMHSKLVIVDEDFVFVGSHNWTRKSLLSDGEISVGLQSRALARSAHAEHVRAWGSARAF